ncbi:MAG: 2-oxoglutarate and iron-dependent oxygenase domain-containing protein, partial [Cyanobacteria bacterium J06607_13]
MTSQTLPAQSMSSTPEQTIPVLDLQDFTSGQNPAAFVSAFGEALCDFGFFALVNHGVEQRIIDAAYGAAEA